MADLNLMAQELRPDPGTFSPMSHEATEKTLDLRQPQAQLAVLGVAVVLAAVMVVWLLARGGGTDVPAVNSGPTMVSQSQLEALGRSTPVYWAGAKDGFSYELTRAGDTRTYIRYLPEGVQAGDPRPDFLTVGTYTQPKAFALLERAGKRDGAVTIRIDGGGLVVYSSKKPTSVYLAYPDQKFQVEVYSPSAETARSLLLSGRVESVD